LLSPASIARKERLAALTLNFENSHMRLVYTTLLAASVALSAAACGGRQVEVRTGPTQTAEIGLQVTNNLSQAVNVYVVSGGSDIFLRQVGANATESLPVQGVATGSNVTLKATTVDGTRTYTKDNVTLAGSYRWQVP
jgi:hypothetical protein